MADARRGAGSSSAAGLHGAVCGAEPGDRVRHSSRAWSPCPKEMATAPSSRSFWGLAAATTWMGQGERMRRPDDEADALVKETGPKPYVDLVS